ncbi:MAG: hypothetical protein KGL39_47460 [Patescibacteria group bacterium]|nr:hypothetical protein [Patescibacteria group bacterium]
MTDQGIVNLELRERQRQHDLDADRAVLQFKRHTKVMGLPADTIAATTTKHAIFKVPAHMLAGVKVVSLKVTPSANVTNGGTGGTDDKTLTFNVADGAGSTASGTGTIDTTVATGLTWAALKPLSVTLSSTTIPAGGILTLGVVPTGAGVVIPASLIEVVYDEL